jgi:hypothetical protein
MAIGDGPSYDVNLVYELLGATWNGRTWTRISVPNPDGAYQLYDVSCTSSTFCMAVGTDDGYQGLATGQGAAAMSWNGKTWTTLDPPTPDDFEIEGMALTSVSCTSANYCLAAGTDEGEDITNPQPSYSVPYLETWNGKRWSLTSPPEPPKVASETMVATSCTAGGFCLAVGNNGRGPSVDASVNGKVRLVANPAGTADFTLQDLTCLSPSYCLLVGSDPNVGVAEVWNGQRLSVTSRMPSTTPAADPVAVTCTSVSRCVATGNQSAFWNGKSWSTAKLAVPRGSVVTFLNDIACTSSTACQAVGFWSPNAKDDPTTVLTESWNGKSWSIEP